MKHQIIFVGGQLLPVFVGIKEFSPDKIHFIVSEESKDKINLLKSFLTGKGFTENICNPFDFVSIKTTCEELLSKFEPTDEVQFNLTGGTKVMVLAAQALIQESQGEGFYINPDNTVLNLPSYSLQEVTCEISVKEFLELSGHKIKSSKTIYDFSETDFRASAAIDLFSSTDKTFLTVSKYFRKNFNDKNVSIPKSGNETIDGKISFRWNSKQIEIIKEGEEIFTASSDNIYNLFFYAAWWELNVAKAISAWTKPKELLLQCELPFKGDIKSSKSEIDVLINLGRKLIFVECKSGFVKQEDINKMKIIKDTYGGIISKSILVSRFLPAKNILEKCNELNIEVFYLYEDEILVHPLSELIKTLDNFEKKLAI
jgi:hypothetical protein